MDDTDYKIDLCSIPLVALNVSVRKKLGLYLNPKHTVAADWTAVAETMGFSYLEIKNYEASRNPTKNVLDDWAARNSEASVGKLLSILEEVERKDIVEDLQPFIGAQPIQRLVNNFYLHKGIVVSFDLLIRLICRGDPKLYGARGSM